MEAELPNENRSKIEGGVLSPNENFSSSVFIIGLRYEQPFILIHAVGFEIPTRVHTTVLLEAENKVWESSSCGKQ
jgi:hypothetical protein